MRLNLMTMLVAVLVVTSVSLAAPITITTADGDGADAYVDRATCANHGSDTWLRTATSSNLAYRWKTYLRFDVSSVGVTVTDATLNLILSVASSETGVAIYGLNDGDAGESWDETAIAWWNAPANDTDDGNGFLSNASYLGNMEVTGATSAGDTVLFLGNSGALTNFINNDTDGQVTLMLGSLGSHGQYRDYASKEHATLAAPTLEMVPEPATVGLLSIGGLLGLARKKR